MTNPTGRSFLSYRRSRKDEAALLIRAQHDHRIPTWQDIANLGSVPTEDEIRRTLADPTTASAILFVTPEVDTSPVIRNVEIPKIIKRSEAGDGFFVVPLAAGGLDYTKAAEITSNHLKALFGASFQCITYRCHDLGIINTATYKRLFSHFADLGWRKPPYEELGAIDPAAEQPKRMERLCFRALAEGLVSESKAAEILGISVRLITRLMDQPLQA